MVNFNTFGYDIILNEKSIAGSERDVFLSISENIFSLCPKAHLSFADRTGFLMDKLLNIQGLPLELKLQSFEDDEASFLGITGNTIFEDYEGKGLLQGILRMPIHSPFLLSQDPSSKAYEGTTSNVIKEVLSSYFSDFDIDDSGGFSKYYQSRKSPKDFVDQISENLYSRTSRDSPYFVWADIDNKVHIKHVNNLLQQSPKVELKTSGDYRDVPAKNIILDIQGETTDFNKNIDYFKVQSTNIDLATGDLATTERSCLNNAIPVDVTQKHLLYEMENSKLESMYERIKAPKETYEEEQLNGRLINSQRDLALVQKFKILTILNTNLRAGDIITIDVTSPFVGETSTTYKGKWLVTSVVHYYDGINKSNSLMKTMITVARQGASLLKSQDYALTSGLGGFSLG